MADFVEVDLLITSRKVTFRELSVRDMTQLQKQAAKYDEKNPAEFGVLLVYFSMRDEDGNRPVESLDAFLDLPWRVVSPLFSLAAKANGMEQAEGNS